MRGEESQHHIFFQVKALNGSLKPLLLLLAQHIIKYLLYSATVHLVDRNDDFRDMHSDLFKSRQGANVTAI